MDVLYIPQLDEGDAGESPAAGRYRLLKRVPEEGAVALTDRAVTRVEVTGAEPLKLVVPPLVKGAVRDFFVRLVVAAEEVPEVTLAAPAGETISFEGVEADVFRCDVGVNVFAFTETDEGIFVVSRKQANVEVEVEFDTCCEELENSTATFRLGASYGKLPAPERDGYTFAGWHTSEGDDGTPVTADDRCKAGVRTLYAHWTAYEDPYADVLSPGGGLVFRSSGDVAWTLDEAPRACARSGAIADNGSTSLTTRLNGPGRLVFDFRVSSEANFDVLEVSVDGVLKDRFGGDTGWVEYALDVAGEGTHTVEWRYAKDSSVSRGSDCAWVADVAWTPREGG